MLTNRTFRLVGTAPLLSSYDDAMNSSAVVRQMWDRRRRLVPALPAGAPGRGLFGRRRPA